MCGIIGYIGKEDPKAILIEGLKRLEYRGYDSAGVAIRQSDHLEVFRSEGRIRNLEKKIGDRKFKGHVGIGHTRWATHGAPIELNAHPHQVGAVTLVHNGIIENYMDHKKDLVKQGREIKSDTDSEIVAHLFDVEISKGKSLQDAVLEVLPKLRGSYAFVVVSEKEPDLMVGVRKGAPLLVGIASHECFLASDVQAVLSYTDRVVYLEDEQIALCDPNGLQILDTSGAPEQFKETVIHWTPDQLDKLGYRHYMLKEIFEQPRALTNTIEGNIDHKKGIVSLADLSLSVDEIKQIRRVSIAACGTARHAGMVGKFLIEQLAGLPVDVDFASEHRYRNPILSKDVLSIFVSQSGETADTLGALKEAKSRGSFTLAICNVRESTIAREADCTIYTNAGPEIGVASTKAFTTQLCLLYMLAIQLGSARGYVSPKEGIALTQDVLRLPILVESTLELNSSIEQMVKELQSLKLFLYLGRGINFPIALEGALKLKEISYLHAEGYPAGELKHGPIALVEPDLVTIALAPNISELPPPMSDENVSDSRMLYEKMMANIQEVKSRGGKIVAFGTQGDIELSHQASYFGGIPRASWALNPILMSIPIQLFAYHMASLMGTDVDKPRNLAKSVTVE